MNDMNESKFNPSISEGVINTLSTLPDNNKGFDRFNEENWKHILDILFGYWLCGPKSEYYKELLINHEYPYFTDEEVVKCLVDVHQYKLAAYAKKALSYAMDGNDLEEFLDDLLSNSEYSDVFKKHGFSLLLGIKDENVWDGYVERTVTGLGLSRMFDDRYTGFNPKTGKYQFVTYTEE